MSASIELVIDGRPRDVGGHSVLRVLPVAAKRSVGPFVFLDHMGPVDIPPGGGFDVRPHPHIGLSTVTFLLEGEVVHKDSVGSIQTIRPGDVNWMTAGRGIVHSERSTEATRANGGRMHGLQIWVALPLSDEECEPEFHHHAAAALPEVALGTARARVVAGAAFGATSPAKTRSPLFFVEASVPAGATIAVPDHEERGVYVVEGAVTIAGRDVAATQMAVLSRGDASLRATQDSRVALLGGAPLGPRHIDWNFVSSSRERIDRAKRDWRERRFPAIPTDDVEYVPLPDWPKERT